MSDLLSPRGSWARHGSYLLAGALGVALLGAGLRRRAAPESALAVPAAAALATSRFDARPVSQRRPAPRARDESASVTGSRAAPGTAAMAPPLQPHPISPAHQRIFEENNRIAALNGALDRGDFAALRALNAEYRSAYPEDEQVLQQGYDLIADCLEQRTAQVVNEARRFWREQRASSLRRYVRRHCLEGVPPE